MWTTFEPSTCVGHNHLLVVPLKDVHSVPLPHSMCIDPNNMELKNIPMPGSGHCGSATHVDPVHKHDTHKLNPHVPDDTDSLVIKADNEWY